jgi:H+-transporting ATPase
VRSGEAYGIVRKTGTNTEIGGAQLDILKDKAETKVSVFEERVLYTVKIIIMISLADVMLIFLIQGLGPPRQFDGDGIKNDLLTCLSIIIASIPIALPLVLQITMALGAAKMATEFDSVVTSLPALQDISSMTILVRYIFVIENV